MMDPRKLVLKETALVAIGEAVAAALMVGVFLLLNKFDLSVLWGALMGVFLTVANFFFLAVTSSLAADRAENQDVEGAKKLVKASRSYRFLGLGAALVVCALSGVFDLLALVLPLLFLRPVLLVAEFFQKKG